MNINENIIPVQIRDINVVTAEIRTISVAARKIMIYTAIELGRRLVEAKELLPHGEWGEWLKREVEFSWSTANNLMKIYREYGSAQESLFGETNSQSFANLTYSQALMLLKVPRDEREEFAQDNDVENLSITELDQAIKAKQEAEKQAAAAAESLKKAEKAAAEAEQKARSAEQTAKSAEQRAAKAEGEKEKAVNALEEEMKAKAKVKAELDNLKANPEIPAETLEKISSEALDKAAAEYERKLEEAQRVAEGAAEQARVLRKELAVANPEVAAFNVYFKQLQEDLGKLSSSLAKIRGMNPETADKLATGAKGVIEQLISNL